MNLLQVRTKLVQESGRYDLVVDTTDYADNGADFYINAGQRWLDRKWTIGKSWARNSQLPSSGTIHVAVEDARAITEMWAMDSDGREPVERKDMSWIRQEYKTPISEIDTGIPKYWAPATFRMTPESDRVAVGDLEWLTGYMDVLTSAHYPYKGAIFFPPTDGTYYIETWGLFYSPSLDADTENSYWTIEQPTILIMAAMRQLEVMHRNREGVKDWESAIGDEMRDIDADGVDEESYPFDQMEG